MRLLFRSARYGAALVARRPELRCGAYQLLPLGNPWRARAGRAYPLGGAPYAEAGAGAGEWNPSGV